MNIFQKRIDLTAWKIQKSPFFESRFKRFQKNHPNETRAMLNNLDSYLTALNEGTNPVNLTAGFIHHEPDGIKGIDQKGSKGKRSEHGKAHQ